MELEPRPRSVIDELRAELEATLPSDYAERAALLPAMDPEFYADPLDENEFRQAVGKHYAWLRLPRWLHERHVTIEETEGPINMVDLASAFPIYRHLMEGLQFRRHHEKVAAPLVRDYFEHGFTKTLPSTDHVALRSTRPDLERKQGAIRPMIESHVQAVVSKLQTSDLTGDTATDTATLFTMLMYELLMSRTIYTLFRDESTYEGRSHIDYVHKAVPDTVVELLAKTPVRSQRSMLLGEVIKEYPYPGLAEHLQVNLKERSPLGDELAIKLCKDMAHYFADELLSRGWARPFRAASVDLEPPVQLVVDSQKSFDLGTRLSGIYTRAVMRLNNDPNHIQGDIFDPQVLDTFEDGTLTNISMFDSFPIYFAMPKDASAEEIKLYRAITLSFAERLFNKLQPNGRLVIFPWNVNDKGPEDERLLHDMELLWASLGADVSIKAKARAQLYDWMSDQERDVLSRHSPIFNTDDDLFKVLEVKRIKPSKHTRVTRVPLPDLS